MGASTFDWRGRYLSLDTPWDLGRAHPELAARIACAEPGLVPARIGARAYVPGCGRGWDALALAERGFAVTAADLVAELAPTVEPALRSRGGRFVVGDALALEDEPFELVFDHTFFCAIDPAQRTDYGAMARRLVVPGGHLCALVFPADKPAAQGGPPFGFDAAVLGDALGEDFELLLAAPALHRVPHRQWSEGWASFRRRL